eukprot:223619-Chlamydomonas_euryale.AAC.1
MAETGAQKWRGHARRRLAGRIVLFSYPPFFPNPPPTHTQPTPALNPPCSPPHMLQEVTETGALGTRGPAASLGKPCILETLPVGSSPGSEGVQLKGAWVRAARGASPRPGAELFFPGQVYITSEAERQVRFFQCGGVGVVG